MIWTVLQKDDPNHLGLRCNAFHAHQMALITSGCVPPRYAVKLTESGQTLSVRNPTAAASPQRAVPPTPHPTPGWPSAGMAAAAAGCRCRCRAAAAAAAAASACGVSAAFVPLTRRRPILSTAGSVLGTSGGSRRRPGHTRRRRHPGHTRRRRQWLPGGGSGCRPAGDAGVGRPAAAACGIPVLGGLSAVG